jgi:hypothetical protein
VHPPGGLAGGLNGGQQKGNEDPDDRDHDQEFNEREPFRYSMDGHDTVSFWMKRRKGKTRQANLVCSASQTLRRTKDAWRISIPSDTNLFSPKLSSLSIVLCDGLYARTTVEG